MVAARPDIAFSVTTLAREASGATPDSWRKVTHLLRYLQGTKNLVFKIQPDVRLQSSDVDLDLHVFSDIDWAGDVATRKRTSGFWFSCAGLQLYLVQEPKQPLQLHHVRQSCTGWVQQPQRRFIFSIYFTRLVFQRTFQAFQSSQIVHQQKAYLHG